MRWQPGIMSLSASVSSDLKALYKSVIIIIIIIIIIIMPSDLCKIVYDLQSFQLTSNQKPVSTFDVCR